MAQLTVLSDLSETPLTRQDLFNAWSTAALGTIVEDELASGFQSIVVASSYSDAPTAGLEGGQLMWVAEDQTMYCYHDEVDDTGVSLWLAIGPDVFETACILAAPAFPGSLVEPITDKWVQPVAYTGSSIDDGITNRMIGNVHSGVPYPLNTRSPDTLASGTWVRVGIDGFIYGWIPNASGTSEGLFSCNTQRGLCAAPIDATHVDGMEGGMIQQVASSGGRLGTLEPYWGFCGISLYTSFNGATASEWGQHIRYRFTGYQDQSNRA
jgi:hypothetical protein